MIAWSVPPAATSITLLAAKVIEATLVDRSTLSSTVILSFKVSVPVTANASTSTAFKPTALALSPVKVRSKSPVTSAKVIAWSAPPAATSITLLAAKVIEATLVDRSTLSSTVMLSFKVSVPVTANASTSTAFKPTALALSPVKVRSKSPVTSAKVIAWSAPPAATSITLLAAKVIEATLVDRSTLSSTVMLSFKVSVPVTANASTSTAFKPTALALSPVKVRSKSPVVPARLIAAFVPPLASIALLAAKAIEATLLDRSTAPSTVRSALSDNEVSAVTVNCVGSVVPLPT